MHAALQASINNKKQPESPRHLTVQLSPAIPNCCTFKIDGANTYTLIRSWTHSLFLKDPDEMSTLVQCECTDGSNAQSPGNLPHTFPSPGSIFLTLLIQLKSHAQRGPQSTLYPRSFLFVPFIAVVTICNNFYFYLFSCLWSVLAN